MRLTRRNQLWVLIILTAITASLQYTLQGALATDATVEAFPDAFWIADYAAWAGRALVEAWVIVYVFTTRTQGKLQTAVLIALEAALLALITLTLGPAFRAIGAGERMYESLTYEGFWLWNFGVAAYTSVMMAAAGIAYRMQPEDVKVMEPPEARRGIDVLRELLEMPLNPDEVLRLVASKVAKEERPTPAALAEMLGVHPATVARVYQEEAENE